MARDSADSSGQQPRIQRSPRHADAVRERVTRHVQATHGVAQARFAVEVARSNAPSDYIRAAYIKSLAEKVQYDFATMRCAPVLEYINALPRAEDHPAGARREWITGLASARFADARACRRGLPRRGHSARALPARWFRRTVRGPCARRDRHFPGSVTTPRCVAGTRSADRSGCLAESIQRADIAGNFVESARARGDGQMMERLLHVDVSGREVRDRNAVAHASEVYRLRAGFDRRRVARSG